jgi:hypothetical protein
MQERIKAQLLNVNQSDKIEILSRLIPEFKQCLDMARTTTLKYNVLTNRLGGDGSSRPNKVAQFGIQLKELLKQDEFITQLDLLDDIVITKQSQQMFSLLQLKGITLDQRPSTMFVQAQVTPGKEGEDESAKAFQQRQTMMNEEQSKLDQADRKLKEADLQKLQLKVKELITDQRDLRSQLQEFERKDHNLICRLEDAICFGKLIFIMKPMLTVTLKEIKNQVYKKFCREFEVSEQEELARFKKRKMEQELDDDSVHQVDAGSEHQINLEAELKKLTAMQQHYQEAGIMPPP